MPSTTREEGKINHPRSRGGCLSIKPAELFPPAFLSRLSPEERPRGLERFRGRKGRGCAQDSQPNFSSWPRLGTSPAIRPDLPNGEDAGMTDPRRSDHHHHHHLLRGRVFRCGLGGWDSPALQQFACSTAARSLSAARIALHVSKYLPTQ